METFELDTVSEFEVGEELGADDSTVTTGALITREVYSLRRVELEVELTRAFLKESANEAFGAIRAAIIVDGVGGEPVNRYVTVASTSVLPRLKSRDGPTARMLTICVEDTGTLRVVAIELRYAD